MAQTTKYYKDRKYVSYDEGYSWIPLDEYRKGDVIQDNSLDCGGTIPRYYRYKINYDNSAVYYFEDSYPPIDTYGYGIYQSSTKKFNTLYTSAISVIINPSYRQYIAQDAFSDFVNLKTVDFGNTLDVIGDRAFINCYKLEEAIMPDSIYKLWSSAFKNCKSLRTVHIPSGITEISNETFNGCHSLSSITIPTNITRIGFDAFKECHSLSSITIPNSVTNIDVGAFSECINLTSISIPNTITAISSSLFNTCISLRNITIPESIASIGDHAFNNCIRLESITIPSAVTSIGSNVFERCISLKTITVLATEPPEVQIGLGVLLSKLDNLYVPSESVQLYKETFPWSRYADKISPIT